MGKRFLLDSILRVCRVGQKVFVGFAPEGFRLGEKVLAGFTPDGFRLGQLSCWSHSLGFRLRIKGVEFRLSGVLDLGFEVWIQGSRYAVFG